MVKIKIFRNAQQLIAGFHMSGHADTAPHGQDIVCAAISALAQTAVLGLECHLRQSFDFDIADGRLRVMLHDAPNQLTSAVLETMLLGLLEIEKINPLTVRITEHRR